VAPFATLEAGKIWRIKIGGKGAADEAGRWPDRRGIAVAGCRAARAAERPFLYRTTIPPPGTITARSSNPERRRLFSPSAGAAAPDLAGASVTPGATLTTVGPPVVTPGVLPRRLDSCVPGDQRLGPAGGFNYQSSKQAREA